MAHGESKTIFNSNSLGRLCDLSVKMIADCRYDVISRNVT